MSFRIENILKKEPVSSSCEKNEKNNGYTVKEEASGFRSVETSSSDSILHKTLMNRLHPPYYRSVSETYPTEKVSPSFHTHGCGRLCYPQGYYYNSYFDNDYQHLYAKSRFYPLYNASLPTIFPLQCSYYSKRKGGQVRFTANQTDVLEKRFLSHKYLSPEDRKILADNLKLSDRQVKTWFQNRRAKWRRSSSSSNTDNSIDAEVQNEVIHTITSN